MDVETYVNRAIGSDYRPFDQAKHLGEPPWRNSPKLTAWEEGHGHDPRLKCYPEFECRVCVIDVDALPGILAQRDADMLRDVLTTWRRMSVGQRAHFDAYLAGRLGVADEAVAE